MDNQKELNPIIKSKDIKETKDLKFTTKENTKKEMELIIAYSQVAFHTLQYSGTDITPKTIKEEIKMFYNKFGNDSVKKLANTIMKEKKEKK